jgi:multidrug resistance efflux pump
VSQNGNTDDGEGSDVDEDELDDVQQNANKKRRLSKSGSGSGPSRTLLVKAVADIEASIKRVQMSVAKEVEKMNGIVKTLNTKIAEMDED